MKKKLGMLAAAVVLSGSMNVVQADTWSEVAKKIGEKAKAIKSATYKSKMVMEVKFPQGSSKTESEGTWEQLTKDGKVLYRSETKSKSVTKSEDFEQKSEGTQQSISDGEFVYSYSDTNGVKSAQKMKVSPDQGPQVDQEKALKEVEKTYTVKMLPDETIDGRPAFVVEMTPKDPAMKDITGKTVTCYCKETGLMLKMTTYSPTGEPQMSVTNYDIKINPSISPDRFKFTPPAGVEVQDLTKAQTP